MNFEVSDLGCKRGDLRVLSHVTFSVKAGSALILRGPNGSGKTTLLRTLAGLSSPEGGTINVSEDSLVYAGHADGLKAQLTVVENLQFWADVFGHDGIQRAMDVFDLHSLANRQAQNLSAGQKRRLGLSRFLVTGRPIWLMDEPTVSLDAQNVAVFAQMVESHLAAGGIAVLATHIDLGLSTAEMLDIAQFKADAEDSGNPFLDEGFL